MHKQIKHNKESKLFLFFVAISLISLIVIAILVGTKTIGWNWLTGFILGEITSVVAIILVFLSVKLLIKS
jgi:hypothetical protein